MEQKEVIKKFLGRMPRGDSLTQLFHEAERTGQVPHALLFSGAVWAGQELWATSLAGALLKHDMEGEENPFRSMDMHYVPDSPKAMTALEARALRDALLVSPRGKRHVVLFPRMERLLSNNLGHEAANTLLKIIEEPPSPTVFLFTTESEFSLLPTLLSRVHKVPCPMVPESFAKDVLGMEEALWAETQGKLSLLLLFQEQTFLDLWQSTKERIHEVFDDHLSITEKVILVSPLFLATKEKEEVGTITKRDLFFYHFELYLEECLKTGTMSVDRTKKAFDALQDFRKHVRMNINKKLALYHFFISLFLPA